MQLLGINLECWLKRGKKVRNGARVILKKASAWATIHEKEIAVAVMVLSVISLRLPIGARVLIQISFIKGFAG